MRQVVAALVLALSLLGCAEQPKRVEAPLVTVETPQIAGVWLFYEVFDVAADPTFGTVDKATGVPFRWPTGYTAWHVGSEIEVVDRSGHVVLTTGNRYRIEPLDLDAQIPDVANWVVGTAKPCPGCKLESGPE